MVRKKVGVGVWVSTRGSLKKLLLLLLGGGEGGTEVVSRARQATAKNITEIIHEKNF